MKKFEIEWRDPKSLTPYHRNNKTHPTQQIDKLAGTIAEFDFDQPIVVDGKGVIIKGHGRREAALRLGLKQVPIIVRADLTPAQVKAARLADNRIAEEGKTDYEAIALEIEDLAELDFDLDLTGFDPAEIDKYLEDSGVEVETGEPGARGRGEGGDSEDAPEDEDTAESKSPPEKYPLAIVLTRVQKEQWDVIKQTLGIKSDSQAFIKVLEKGVLLNG